MRPDEPTAFQHLPDLDQARQLPLAEPFHEKPPPRDAIDHSLLGKSLQGIHDRRAAHAHLAGQAVNLNALPGEDTALQDEGSEAGVNLVFQVLLLDGERDGVSGGRQFDRTCFAGRRRRDAMRLPSRGGPRHGFSLWACV